MQVKSDNLMRAHLSSRPCRAAAKGAQQKGMRIKGKHNFEDKILKQTAPRRDFGKLRLGGESCN